MSYLSRHWTHCRIPRTSPSWMIAIFRTSCRAVLISILSPAAGTVVVSSLQTNKTNCCDTIIKMWDNLAKKTTSLHVIRPSTLWKFLEHPCFNMRNRGLLNPCSAAPGCTGFSDIQLWGKSLRYSALQGLILFIHMPQVIVRIAKKDGSYLLAK